MIIGIDISMLVYRGSGVTNYTYNLVKNLLKYDKKNEYMLFYSSLRRPRNFYYLEEFKKLRAKVYDYRFPPRVLKFLWNKHHMLPVEWLIGKVDAYHSSDFLRPPLLKGTKGITTIHDLTWRIYPEYHTPDIVEAHERKMQKTIKYKDIIIVDSYNTKRDLYKYYPQVKKNNKVYVIYPGIDERFKPIKDKEKIKKVLAKYKVEYPKRYLLYVGAIEPRKNLDTAIKVFSRLIKDKNYSDLEFLIVGRAGWKNEEIFQLIKDLGLDKKVKFVGFVEDEDLPYFYNAAKVLVYLSKYEGFGLPPLEALACGIPVLAGENSSIQEILPRKYLTRLEHNSHILKKLKTVIQLKEKQKSLKSFYWKNCVVQFLKVINIDLIWQKHLPEDLQVYHQAMERED